MRTCGWCQVDIGHMVAIAKYCSLQHKRNAASARHRERNPGYYARYSQSATRVAYVDANRELLRKKAREYQQAQRRDNPEHRIKQAAWWSRNRRKRYEYVWRRRAKLYGLTEDQMLLDIRDWDRLVNRYQGCCAYCSKRPDVIHMDHIIPISRGGLHRIGNVLPACKSCNSKKKNRLLAEWKLAEWKRATGEWPAEKGVES